MLLICESNSVESTSCAQDAQQRHLWEAQRNASTGGSTLTEARVDADLQGSVDSPPVVSETVDAVLR